MKIVQVVPEVRTGRGVEAVAFHLEREWQRLGIETQRFTLHEAAGGWLPQAGSGIRGHLVLAGRVIWFSTVGTVLARRMMGKADSDTVVICHNDVLAGDVYVNHGIVAEAMLSRGHRAARMVRNPLHLFTLARDAFRYASDIHRVVVNLTEAEARALRRTYPRVRARTVVIGNGIDLARYAPDQASRAKTRSQLGLRDDDVVALFVGHEYERKGLPLIFEALPLLPDHLHLVIVGGTEDMVDRGRLQAKASGLSGRVHYVGAQADPRPFFHASDVFVFPSAYEAYPLVVLEALASGLPVVATPVGSIPELIVEGENGFIVDRTATSVKEGIVRYLSRPAGELSEAARASAQSHDWGSVAREYLTMFDTILSARSR